MYKVTFLPDAEDFFKSLDKPIQRRYFVVGFDILFLNLLNNY